MFDLLAWVVGLALAVLVRYDLDINRVNRVGLAWMIGLAGALQVGVGLAVALYRRRYRYGSFEETAALGAVVLTVTACLVTVDLAPWHERPVPLSVALAGGVPALVAMASVRYLWRVLSERKMRPQAAELARMLVFGAGVAGQRVVDALLRDPGSPYLPVALLDDDPAKRNLRIRGVRVAGGRGEIAAARDKYAADTLLLAVPSADAALMRELSRLAEDAGLVTKVLPPVRELIDGNVGAADIRDLDVTDLLGRRQVKTDIDSIAGYISNKRVLVTGAGGSIGSELCRQLRQFGPAELIMLDRDESALHALELSMHGRALLDDSSTVLADLRDEQRIFQIFAERRPHVVFHAAALKHLPLLERHPGEAVRSNVWGTLTVLEAARRTGVERFVNISTDKAAAPTSVLGTSKRLAERLTAHFAATSTGSYLSVRFGNVLGSRGSVLTTFQAQVAAGGPLTVTHPDVTRFFMTVHEAVELLIQAGAIGAAGDVLVLDMGEPVRIADVAHQLAATAHRPVHVVFTGLRPGEKLHEDLFAPDERDVRPVHDLISHVAVPAIDPAEVRRLDPAEPPAAIVAQLEHLCRTPGVRDLAFGR